MTRALPKILATWLLMLVVSVANGIFRDIAYGRYLSELAAHQLSTLLGVLLLGLVIRRHARREPFPSLRAALSTGILWVSMTIAFEFLFFHYVGGHAWSSLLANYDLSAGKLWPLLLLWIAVAPSAFFYFAPRKRNTRP